MISEGKPWKILLIPHFGFRILTLVVEGYRTGRSFSVTVRRCNPHTPFSRNSICQMKKLRLFTFRIVVTVLAGPLHPALGAGEPGSIVVSGPMLAPKTVT